MDDSRCDCELVKLAVSLDVRGNGIGCLLCETVIDKAKSLGAKRMFLESNTLLKHAIHIEIWGFLNLQNTIRLMSELTCKWNSFSMKPCVAKLQNLYGQERPCLAPFVRYFCLFLFIMDEWMVNRDMNFGDFPEIFVM
ncbi:MAG: GNAT family N-acetyltransferase [Bacteroidales bacterium]|nr:GNAT family N-acetyltransferase [Bacteroidales bacterium]MCM1147628.1 GNAT family N-acetyltransferase [Bacteroidales bacterium]MCM1206419.1 GNAT family N-acetyltransferase [Bacillota bacterium]